MMSKKISSLLFTCLLSIISIGQINNIIFLGGVGDGSANTCYALKSSNHIFSGGIAHGYKSSCYTISANNLIFAGGNYDGNTSICFTISSNNAIFTGGPGDGNMQLCYQVISNTPIFAGGISDGNASFCYTTISNNSIFVGGRGDGIDLSSFKVLSNNPIFAGSAGDGYDLGKYQIHNPTIVWHGLYSSNWYYPFNWDQLRIPTIEDFVIIRTEKYDPFIKSGFLGIGDQSPGIKERARNIYILNGSGITLDNKTKASIRRDFNIYGSLVSLNKLSQPVIQLLPGGKLTIFDQGFLHMLTM